MFKAKNPITTRTSLLGFAGLALLSSLMIGCGETDPTPDGCTGSDSLYICREVLLDTGAAVYAENCTGCHGDNAEGGRGPTLRNSDYVMGGTERLIVTLLHGVNDTIFVNGRMYPGGGMAAWEDLLSNKQIASVLTYIRAGLNDSLVSDCVADPVDPEIVTCTKTARSATDIANDSIPVWQVKAVRDTLTPLAP